MKTNLILNRQMNSRIGVSAPDSIAAGILSPLSNAFCSELRFRFYPAIFNPQDDDGYNLYLDDEIVATLRYVSGELVDTTESVHPFSSGPSLLTFSPGPDQWAYTYYLPGSGPQFYKMGVTILKEGEEGAQGFLNKLMVNEDCGVPGDGSWRAFSGETTGGTVDITGFENEDVIVDYDDIDKTADVAIIISQISTIYNVGAVNPDPYGRRFIYGITGPFGIATIATFEVTDNYNPDTMLCTPTVVTRDFADAFIAGSSIIGADTVYAGELSNDSGLFQTSPCVGPARITTVTGYYKVPAA